MIKKILILVFSLLGCLRAHAVPLGSIPVGECVEGIGPGAIKLIIWDTPPLPPTGLKMVIVQRGVGLPPFQELPARPDPSGQTLLAILSPDINQRVWIDWHGNLMATVPTGIAQVGQCILNTAFANQFVRPVAPPLPNMMNALVGFGIANSQPTAIPVGTQSWRFQMPSPVNVEGTFTPPPILLSAATAKDCLNQTTEKNEYFSCVIKKVATKKQGAAYECAATSKSQNELALCLLAANIGNNEKAAVETVRKCYAQNQTNWNAYPICMAGENIDPNIQRLVACTQQMAASGQSNYWALGMCTFGPTILASLNPNAETMVAIQCAAQSGGNPQVFVGCTAGELAVRELDKCLKDGIGTDNGCFGPNNSLSNAYDQIGQGIAKAFGEHSAAYQAWQLAVTTQDPRKAIEAINNVREELNKAGTNISQNVKNGLDQMAEGAYKVIPQVTIKKPSGKIFGKKWSL